MPTAPLPTTDAKVEAQVFWIRFHKEIVAVLVLAILGAIGFAGYRFYSEQQKTAAATMLGAAKKAQDYEDVIKRYPATPAGASACILLAEAQRAEKNYAASNATLQDFISKHPQHELAGTARVAMAANLELMNKIDDALLMYQSAAASDPKSFNAPLALISEVRLLKAANRTEDARRICEKIVSEYSDSMWMGEAMRELRELKPSAPPTAGNFPPSGAPAPPPLIARPPAAALPAGAPTAKPK